MIFKNICVLVLGTEVASALELLNHGSVQKYNYNATMKLTYSYSILQHLLDSFIHAYSGNHCPWVFSMDKGIYSQFPCNLEFYIILCYAVKGLYAQLATLVGGALSANRYDMGLKWI